MNAAVQPITKVSPEHTAPGSTQENPQASPESQPRPAGRTQTSGGDFATFRADLEEQSLAQLLATIDHHRLSGVLRAQCDGVSKELHMRDGYVLFARSSDLRDSLGVYLIKKKILTEEALERIRQHPEFRLKKLGVLLMEQQLLLPSQIRSLVQQQVANIAWSLFSWRRGTVSFEIREVRDIQSIRIQIPLKQMVLKGNLKAPAVERMLKSLGGEDAVFVAVPNSDSIIDAALDETEYSMLLSVDGRRTVADLCDEPPLEPEDNVRLLHALHVLRLIDWAEKVVPGQAP